MKVEIASTLLHLGFKPGDSVWISASWSDRSPPPSTWPINKKGEPIHRIFTGTLQENTVLLTECKLAGKDEDGDSVWTPSKGFIDTLHTLNELGKAGASIFFYPNKPQGGICNKHIDTCDLIFYEADNATIEDQWENLERFMASTGLVPCLVAYSGGKSLHVYFKLDSPLAGSDFQRLQRKLCILQNSDPLVTNLCRAMRLPHMARGSNQVSVEFSSNESYEPVHLEAKLDESGLFPHGLSDARWSQWVRLRNRRAKGEAVDPTSALLDPALETKVAEVKKLSTLKAIQPSKLNEAQRIDRLIREALDAIPPRRKGEGSYDQYRLILTVLCQHYGEAEGIAIMESHSPSSDCGWSIPQVARSTRTSGDYRPEALFSLAQKEFGWTFPNWAKTYQPIVDKSPPKLKPKQKDSSEEIAPTSTSVRTVNPFNREEYRRRKRLEKHFRKLAEMKEALGLDCEDADIGKAIWEKYHVQGDRKAATCEPIRYTPPGLRKLIALDAPKANRKTSRALKGLVDKALALGKRVYVITSTRILSISAGGTLAIVSHAGCEEWRGYLAHVVCPESVHHWGDMASPHVVILDEAEVVLPRLLRATLCKAQKKHLVRKAFIEALRMAEMVVLSQDGLSNVSVEAAKTLGQFRDHEVEYQLYSMPKELQGLSSIRLYSDWRDPLIEEDTWDGAAAAKEQGHQTPALYAWLNDLKANLDKGRRIVIPCGAETNARALYRLIRKNYPHLTVAIFDGKHTPKRAKRAFARDCNQWIQDNQPDVLIYTPLFNDGVSIELDYFDAIFDWTSPAETANSSSQRPERIRAALGFVIKDGKPVPSKLTVRHTYISNTGCHMSDSPKVELDLDEITKRVAEEFLGDYRKVPQGAIGRHRQAEMDLTEQLAPIIARFDQLELISTYQRKALLEQEWAERRGWKISQMGGCKKAASPFAQELEEIKAEMEDQLSRIQAKARTDHLHPQTKQKLMQSDRPGPIGQYRVEKLKQEDLLGADFEELADWEWQRAWSIVTDPQLNLGNLRMNALIQLDIEFPGLLDQLAQETAAAVLRGSHGLCAPIHNKVVQQAILIRGCKEAVLVATGERVEWCKDEQSIQADAKYILEHSAEFSAYSKWASASGRALVFSDKTPTIKLFHKVLGMLAAEATLDRKEGKYNRRYYRQKNELDIKAKIEEAISEGDAKKVRGLEIALKRYQTKAGALLAITEQLKEKLKPLLEATEEERRTFLTQLLSPLMLSVLRERIPACMTRQAFEELGKDYSPEMKLEVWNSLSQRERERIIALMEEAA